MTHKNMTIPQTYYFSNKDLQVLKIPGINM
jgi:hypothetical protein